ncbi:luciferase [Halobacteriales archaeon QS_1_68_20]|nr:MAG: luciferase [Halobacteriales archaeon QS_1_68_20]
MLTSDGAVVETGLDAAALKPTECDLSRARELLFDRLVLDWEGPENLPDEEMLADLAATADVRVTTPVRADGFDPLGDEGLLERLPDDVGKVVVAGHPAYLTEQERSRAVAPRLGAAARRDPDAWVGSESVERIALATGNAQFELLSPGTEQECRALRGAGFDGDLAVYAPTVLTADDDARLDAVGGYVARRGRVARALPDDAATDATAEGRAREVLLKASADYALVGTAADVRERVRALKDAGADYVVGYPARGVEEFLD